MKVFTTTPTHDKPYLLTPIDVMAMLDMNRHWLDNPDTAVTIKPTLDGTDVYMFISPKELEWAQMRANSIITVRIPSGQLEPFLLS